VLEPLATAIIEEFVGDHATADQGCGVVNDPARQKLFTKGDEKLIILDDAPVV
jgi:hypothetical protein